MRQILIIILLCAVSSVAQSSAKKFVTKKSKGTVASVKKAVVLDEAKKKQEEYDELGRQSRFRSPFRYVIISNITHEELDIPQRRLEILMDKNAFNEKNLKILFSLLKNRFPLPIRLEISVHTSLQTIETPEEQEMLSDHTSREDQLQYHKTALYIRFDDGSEGFQYDYGKPPGFWRKFVDLPNSKQKPKGKSVSRN
jgi:hypothetical protein